jgi:hypothetical protein
MEDLESERELLAIRLKDFNFEPVNAETMLPSGATSWDRISEELETCHILILISGTRYGWIPTSGPLASEGISVTHGEYRAARRLEIPVLPFFKTLKYSTSMPTDDSKKRDSFRREIADWDTGHFRAEFSTAHDLADKASAAVSRMLSDHFQRNQIALRRSATPATMTASGRALALSSLPYGLVQAVREGRALLWSGSGISLSSGLPSGSLIAAEFVRFMSTALEHPYVAPAVGSGLASVATDLESLLGRATMIGRMKEMLDLPGGVRPSVEHLQAIKLFPGIITTNYDELFERAAQESYTHQAVTGPVLSSPPERFIWKIHGSVNSPDSIVLSENDISNFEQYSEQVISSLLSALKGRVLLVGETSLRDPSIYRLFRAVKGRFEGYWSVPFGDRIAIKRAEELGLQPIEASLSEILQTLITAFTSS